MRPEQVRQLLRAQPFVPFRVRLTNGQTYDVAHPELCIVGHHVLHVGMPTLPQEPFADRVVIVALVHVAELIPLTPGLVA